MADTYWAAPEDIQSATRNQWSADLIYCRTYGHGWRPHTVLHDRAGYLVVQRCTRCKNKRQQTMDHNGYAGPWHVKYENDDYLLPKHTGRVDQHGKAVLRLAALTSLTITEVPDEEAAS